MCDLFKASLPRLTINIGWQLLPLSVDSLISHNDYIIENLEKVKNYAELVGEKTSQGINYGEKLAESVDHLIEYTRLIASKADQGIAAAAAAQTTADSKEDAFTSTTETFTGLTGAANASISITLGQIPKVGFNIGIFFNGLRVKTQTRTNGSKVITFTVPYTTEASDDIIVSYCY